MLLMILFIGDNDQFQYLACLVKCSLFYPLMSKFWIWNHFSSHHPTLLAFIIMVLTGSQHALHSGIFPLSHSCSQSTNPGASIGSNIRLPCRTSQSRNSVHADYWQWGSWCGLSSQSPAPGNCCHSPTKCPLLLCIHYLLLLCIVRLSILPPSIPLLFNGLLRPGRVQPVASRTTEGCMAAPETYPCLNP